MQYEGSLSSALEYANAGQIEITFVRWETFCYPMFFDDWDSYRNTGFTICNIKLIVPKEYDVVASKKEKILS